MAKVKMDRFELFFMVKRTYEVKQRRSNVVVGFSHGKSMNHIVLRFFSHTCHNLLNKPLNMSDG